MKKSKLIIGIIVIIVIVGGVGSALSGGDDSKEDKQSEKKTEKEAKSEYAIGESAEVGDVKITVNSTRIDEGLVAADEGKVYFVMDITLENMGDEEFSSSSLANFELKDAEGRKQDLSIGANLNGSMDTTIPAGEKATGEIAFEVAPEGTLVLSYRPDIISSDSVKIVVR